MTGSNRRPSACKADALPAELILHNKDDGLQLNVADHINHPSKFNLATSYSHRGKPPTTIGAEELNFRVRHGNGCDLFAIVTRYVLNVV